MAEILVLAVAGVEMDEDFLNALLAYIQAKIDYEFACREVGEDGYTTAPHRERKDLEAALKNLQWKRRETVR